MIRVASESGFEARREGTWARGEDDEEYCRGEVCEWWWNMLALQARRRRHVVESAPFRGRGYSHAVRTVPCGTTVVYSLVYSHQFGYHQRK